MSGGCARLFALHFWADSRLLSRLSHCEPRVVVRDMDEIQNLNVKVYESCCEKVLNNFIGDYEKIYKDTRNYYSSRTQERQYRITGSTCYKLYMYGSNKKANRKKK